MRTFLIIARVVLAAAACVPGSALAQSKSLAGLGIVLLHGKGGQPEGLIASLAAAIAAEGAEVVRPRMPWSGSQGRPDGYVMTYEQAVAQIRPAVEQLKSKGVTKVVVGGQSLGANAAIAYAARHGTGLAGVIALAAGHTPERMRRQDLVQGLAAAKELVAAGKGSIPTLLPDLNMGQVFQVRATPAAYVSYFDPSGPAVIPRNAAAMPPIPFLWVIGRSDPLSSLGRAYAFDRAAKHAKSAYVEVEAGHADTPNAARREVIAWLRSL